MSISVWSYLKEYEEESAEILAAVDQVFRSGTLVFGEKLRAFEEAFARYCDSTYGIGVGTCTDGLTLAMRALALEQGDEVLTVSNTAIPTVSAIVQAGCVPAFVDVSERDYLMDAALLEKAVTARTRAILPVHLFGQCVEMDVVNTVAQKHNLKVVEDCAQAHGSTYKGRKAGSMSDASTFSFYPTKTLGAYGDGGMVVTNNQALSTLLHSLRFYGCADDSKPSVDRKYYAEIHGYNSRLDEVQAAILLTKLAKIEGYINKRRQLAEIYDRELAGTALTLPVENEGNRHTYYVYVVRHPERTRIIEELKQHDILVNISYPHPIHLMNGYQYLGYGQGSLPVTERLATEIFSLPMYPSLSFAEQRRVIDVLKKIA